MVVFAWILALPFAFDLYPLPENPLWIMEFLDRMSAYMIYPFVFGFERASEQDWILSFIVFFRMWACDGVKELWRDNSFGLVLYIFYYVQPYSCRKQEQRRKEGVAVGYIYLIIYEIKNIRNILIYYLPHP